MKNNNESAPANESLNPTSDLGHNDQADSNRLITNCETTGLISQSSAHLFTDMPNDKAQNQMQNPERDLSLVPTENQQSENQNQQDEPQLIAECVATKPNPTPMTAEEKAESKANKDAHKAQLAEQRRAQKDAKTQELYQLIKVSEGELKEFYKAIKRNMPPNHHFTRGHIVYQEDDTKPILRICSALAITARTIGDDARSSGLQIKWIDKRGRLLDWTFSQELLSEDPKKISSVLNGDGIKYISTKTKERGLFMELINTSTPNKEITHTEKIGWRDGAFVLPDQILGNGKDIAFKPTGTKYKAPKVVGNVKDWREKIGKYCIGNPVLMIGACIGFAAILCGLIGSSAFMLHIMGASSKGKTIAIGFMCSIMGMDKNSWRGTDNAAESELHARNHIGQTKDEITQGTGNAVMQTTYMIGNGEGKARAGSDGEMKPVKTFTTVVLSTGELSIEDHLKSKGKEATGGMLVRCIQGRSDTFKYGCFDDLHEFEDGKHFATAMERNMGISGDSYTPAASGAVGIGFIKKLIENVGIDVKKITEIKHWIESGANTLAPEGSDSQVGRMAKSMAMVIVAGELATEYGLTGWKKGDATKECMRWWKECVLPTRGSLESTESKNELATVVKYFESESHQNFCFPPEKNHDQGTKLVHGKFYGYLGKHKDEDVFFVNGAGIDKACEGVDKTRTLELLEKKGLLLSVNVEGGKKRLNTKVTICKKQSRYYIISQRITEATD